MRQDQDLPILTVSTKRISFPIILFVFLAVMVAGCSGCKREETVKVPQAILQAKSASIDDLLQIVNHYGGLKTLQVRINAEYVSLEQEHDVINLTKYPKAPGSALFKRPDTAYIVIKNPVVKKRELSLLSKGDVFKAWIHGKGVFYEGKNSSKELVSDDKEETPKITIRATHILQAVLPETIPLDDPTIRLSRIEARDESAKYYVLTVYRSNGTFLLRPLREYQIERAGLTLARQRIFNDDGRLIADITYSDVSPCDNFMLPGEINIDRPVDGYTLNLKFTDWRVNPVLEEDRFKLEPPDGVIRKYFK